MGMVSLFMNVPVDQTININSLYFLIFRRKYRILESIKIKIIKKQWSIKYSKTCIKKEILPNYIKCLFNNLLAKKIQE